MQIAYLVNKKSAEYLFYVKVVRVCAETLLRYESKTSQKRPSFREDWAERAFQLGLPERFAMVALGHNSPAVHRAYCKNAKMVCPSLDSFSAARARTLDG